MDRICGTLQNQHILFIVLKLQSDNMERQLILFDLFGTDPTDTFHIPLKITFFMDAKIHQTNDPHNGSSTGSFSRILYFSFMTE